MTEVQSYVLMGTIRDLEHALEAPLRAERRTRVETTGEFPFIPLRVDMFLDLLGRAQSQLQDLTTTPTFIDAGCGFGTKVALAHHMGFKAFGIEKSLSYYKIARELTGFRASTIIRGDAIRHDYAPYNVVYFYRPLQDTKKQARLERRIIRTVKPGAVIIAVGHNVDPLWRGPLVKEHSSHIYIKQEVPDVDKAYTHSAIVGNTHRVR